MTYPAEHVRFIEEGADVGHAGEWTWAAARRAASVRGSK